MPPTVYDNVIEWSSNGITVAITALRGRVAGVDNPNQILLYRDTVRVAQPLDILDAETFRIQFTADAVTPWNGHINGLENALAFSIRIGGRHIITPLIPRISDGNVEAISITGTISRSPHSRRWEFLPDNEECDAIDPTILCLPRGSIGDPVLSLDVGFIDVIINRVRVDPNQPNRVATGNDVYQLILYPLLAPPRVQDLASHFRFFFRDNTISRNWFPGGELPASADLLSFDAQRSIVDNFITYLRRLDPDQPDPDDD